jgi:aspartate/methionine/tyrosine aminotransferase
MPRLAKQPDHVGDHRNPLGDAVRIARGDGERDDWSLTEFLIDRAAIGSTPGTAFGSAGADHIRFAFSCSGDQIKEAARLLPEVMAEAGTAR